MPSTYHQCVKGRFNGKPIRIPANPTPFDLSEEHNFEAIFYDELTPNVEDSTSRPIGIPLPRSQDIENNPEIDMRSFLDQRKKKRECGEPIMVSHSHNVYRSNCQMVIWGIVYDDTWGLAVSNRKVPG